MFIGQKKICVLRWLKTVSCTFQDIDFDGSLLPLFVNWCYNHGIKTTAQLLVNTLVSFSWHNMLPWQHYYLLKTPLISALSAYISKTARWNFLLISNFNKQDKMQLLTNFKKNLYMGFRATLNFRKFKVALNPMHRIFFELCQKLRLVMLIKFW